MPELSNLRNSSDGRSPEAIRFRVARPEEVDAAVRKLLLTPYSKPDDRTVMDFLRHAADRGIDVCSSWVAVRSATVESAVLPIISPGNTVLLLVPRAGVDRAGGEILTGLIRAVCEAFESTSIRLVQVLAEDHDETVIGAIRDAGFAHLAELLYLERSIRSWTARESDVSGTLVTYSPSSHELFASAILESYSQTLDCPGLSGVREIDDVIAGHQAAGDFDPAWWQVVVREGKPSAVLLLSPHLRERFVELVYLGIAPPHRGQGLGRQLLKHAIARCALERFPKLSLAVDSMNVPALRLYNSHGLKQVASRQAWMRVLHRGS